MKPETIKISLSEVMLLCRGEIYWVEGKDFNKDSLTMKTGHFDTAEIQGTMEGIEARISFSNLVFRDVVFKDCVFESSSWLDMSKFIRCKFINCIIKGDMRWVDFNSCHFEKTTFNQKYSRASVIRKNCTANELKFKTEQVDEYIFLFGERYSAVVFGGVNKSFKRKK